MQIVDSNEELVSKLASTLNTSGAGAITAHDSVRAAVLKSGEVIKQVSSRKLFVTIDGIENALQNYDNELMNSPDRSIIRLKNLITHFSSQYELFVRSYDGFRSMELIVIAGKLLAALLIFKETLLSIRSQLENPMESYENMGSLKVFLISHLDLDLFAKKLSAISEIYTELCSLMGISVNEHPAKIAKIESGSFWVKFFGDSKVTTLMTDLIASGASYLYRNFTHEGKVVSIPKKVEAIEAILNLSLKLEGQGIDTSKIKEHIEKSSVVLARNLHLLLAGEAVVEVNETRYSVGEVLEKEYIDQSKRLLLENKELENKEN